MQDGLKHPLVVFSHGAGGNGSGYAWFGEYLASRGYFVAMVYHYRANTYDSSALYVRNRLWQRPRDISLNISYLLDGQVWGPHIDPDRIGVAGHSQGGFTSLWIGGAEVNPDLFLRYQRGWKNNQIVPAYLREQMQVDAAPALDVRDRPREGVLRDGARRHPGVRHGRGRAPADEDPGLHHRRRRRRHDAAEGECRVRRASNIPQAELDIMPGRVGHEIFDNECDQVGIDNYPEACVDAPGVDRAKLHEHIGAAEGGGLARQRQACRTDLAARGAEGP